jgi:uncharacterized Zn finger protein
MDPIKFLVKEGKGNYPVTFSRQGDKLTALCTCPASEYGILCKHQIALMKGDSSIILSDNKEDILKVQDMVRGTEVEEAWNDYLEMEKELERFQKEFLEKVKTLSRKMVD